MNGYFRDTICKEPTRRNVKCIGKNIASSGKEMQRPEQNHSSCRFKSSKMLVVVWSNENRLKDSTNLMYPVNRKGAPWSDARSM